MLCYTRTAAGRREKVQPSSGHTREKRPIMYFRGHGDLSYSIKSGRMSGMLVSGNAFRHHLSTVSRH